MNAFYLKILICLVKFANLVIIFDFFPGSEKIVLRVSFSKVHVLTVVIALLDSTPFSDSVCLHGCAIIFIFLN
jgi:hypothetical protein